ncbi:heme-binding domain-containing protein [Pedobacter panaciterrae]|uniref:heme-binding domain-containing protein n=1 Tax=Pedobacter panaciterrae TaxID=363849 RepID=UPI002594176B|nr:heme-binding domain-containing protein [uncultured Pedobacter sp.]
MNRIKAGLVALLIILFAMQLIQPIRNRNGQVVNKDSGKILRVPEQVQGIFKKSCYDCHSNQAEYPWYTYIQPIGWWMDSHVRKGKEELNFNEFGVYSKRRQLSKLKSIGQSIEDETMPLSSYTFIHKNTKLSKKDKALILDWVKNTINTQ